MSLRVPLALLAVSLVPALAVREPTASVPLLDHPGGHSVEVTVDGWLTEPFLVDTAATVTVVPEAMAAALGLAPGDGAPTRAVQGLTATVRLPVVTLPSLRIGGREVRDVEAVVLPGGSGSLLGLNVLRPLGARVDLGARALDLPGRGVVEELRDGVVAAARARGAPDR
ncbi:retroviral-like aspartic protease family protein [Myxococcota bacterium]|nr:retroviral-like aspartic protease family protein [Myxococcota bacterium]